MNYLFIRTYDKDDYLARLCYESWKLAGYEGEVIFYCQRKCPHPTYDREYVPNWIEGIGRHIFHDNLVSNFGGTDGVNALLEGLRQIDFKEDDYVITCDTDVVIKRNPLEFIDSYTGFAGTGDHVSGGLIHISGQLQIIKGSVLKEIVKDTKDHVDQTGNAMIKFGLGICDDTYMSYRAFQLKANIFLFKNLWVHTKCYQYEPRTDWANIINEINIADE